jgi:hypothetical protein
MAVVVVPAACSSGSAESPPTTAEPTTTTTEPPVAAIAPRVVVPAESRPVAPAAGAALEPVRRDCGFSIPLPAGGALWVYCDTTLFDGDRLRWFVNTSAALATDEDPLVMLDHVGNDGVVAPFLEPDSDYPDCGGGENRFTWPMSGVMVADPDGSPDEPDRQVAAVWYHNVCVVPDAFEGRDAGLAVFEPPAGAPDPAPGPEDREPLEGEIVDDRIIPDPAGGGPFGQAAVRVGDLVYLYRCPRADAGCEVARVPADLEAVSDRTRYEVWTGSGWAPHGADGSAAAPMEVPDPAWGLKPSVAWIEDLGVYVYVDHRMASPGTVLLRVADEPWGPWSPAAEVDLPGCDADWPDVCFAVEVHEHLSADGEVGLTWFDPAFPRGEQPPLRFAAVGVEVGNG